MESLNENSALSIDKFNKCGELFRSPRLNDKQYMFLSCFYCKTISWDLDTFFSHLDHSHPTLADICLNVYKEKDESINEECLKNVENIMEIKTGHNSPTKEFSYVTNDDPLDESHCDFGDLLEDTIKMEINDSTVCDRAINIKTEIEIISNNSNEESQDSNNGNDSYDDDYEPNQKTFEYFNHQDAVHAGEGTDDITDDENKNNTNLRNLTKNRNLIKHVIKAYQRQNILWDRSQNSSTVAKNEALLSIVKGLNEKFNSSVNLPQLKHLIKHLKFRFIQHLRLREQPGETNKNLWCFELMKFLEPHLKETKLKTGICKKLNDAEFRSLTKLLRENECFWNENNIYHTSVLKKQELLKKVINDFTKLCGSFKDVTINVMQNTLDEIITMAREENSLKMQQHLANDNRQHHVYRSNNKFFKEIEFLLPHVGPFQCKHCPKTFGDIYAYKFHVSKHEGTKPFKCMQCSRELTHKKEFVCHLRRHTKECPFQCEACDKSFPSQKEWHRHVIKHGSKPYVCELCADSFYTQHQLTNHMKNHNNIRDHVCLECGKGFTHRGLLRQHLQTHNKTKCFCTLCDNIYSNPRSLRKHYVRVHESGQQPTNASLAQYNCQICKITFATIQDAKQHRKEHKQSHPTEGKHICDICGHHFAYPRNLADHKKTHSNVRDQVCDICGKAFTNANLLNQHKNVHTGEKFVCKACGKDYAHYRGLCRHITKVHGTNIRDLEAMLERQKIDSSL